MPRTRAIALAGAVTLLLGLSVSTVSAGGVTEFVIGPGDGEIGTGLITDDGGTTWSPLPGPTIAGCGSGLGDGSSGVPADTEFRSAVEFPLSGLPDGVVIEWVELHLSAAIQSSTTFVIYTYSGDGSITPEDLEVTGTPYPTVFTTAGSREMVYFAEDIPAPILAAGWLGFSMRLDPQDPSLVHWICPEGETSDLGPVLAVGYSMPTGSQVPDAAMAAPSSASPLTVVGFAMLALAGLMMMALIRGRRAAGGSSSG
jgi:hypothetical protein